MSCSAVAPFFFLVVAWHADDGNLIPGGSHQLSATMHTAGGDFEYGINAAPFAIK